MLVDFTSFFMAPHLKGQSANTWFELMQGGDTTRMMQVGMRKPETGLPFRSMPHVQKKSGTTWTNVNMTSAMPPSP